MIDQVKQIIRQTPKAIEIAVMEPSAGRPPAQTVYSKPITVTSADRRTGKIEIVQEAALDYPMSLKEHGPDFALDNRHLWIRMQSQWAILKARVKVMSAVREYLDGNGFFRIIVWKSW